MFTKLQKKTIFLGIIFLALFSIPFLAHGQEEPQTFTQHCFIFHDYENWNGVGDISYKQIQYCYGTAFGCTQGRIERGGQVNLEEGDRFDNCLAIVTPSEERMPDVKKISDESIPGSACSFTSPDIQGCLKEIVNWGLDQIVSLSALILKAASQVFNLAVRISIIDFYRYANSQAIELIWGLGRDLANICFIFILIYIAIATIVGKDGINTKSLIVKLLITALLINFSIILPKVIIDVGNSLAIVFYKNMGEAGESGTPDISGLLVRSADVTQFFDKKINTDSPESTSNPIDIKDLEWKLIFISKLGTVVLILVLSYALLMATYFFLARTLTLIILIATSSLAFFSRIVPIGGLNKFDDWFQRLIKETFFAPAFMFMFYLTLKVAVELPQLISTPAESTPANSDGASLGLLAQPVASGPTATPLNINAGDQFFGYVLLVGLSLGSIIMARKVGSWSGALGANWMNNQVKKYSRSSGAWAARNTAGRLASSAVNSEKMKNWTTKMPLMGGAARSILNKTANAKFGSDKSYDSARKDRVNKLKADMEGMNSEQKAKYMRNLSGGGLRSLGINNRELLYREGLSDEDRSKIEGAAIGTVKAGAKLSGQKKHDEVLRMTGSTNDAETARRAEEARYESANMTKDTAFIVNQRTALKGEEKIKTYIQKIKGEKDINKKIELLKELGDEKEIKEVVKGLDEQTLAKIKTSPGLAGLPQVYQDAINNRANEMDTDSAEKLEKAEKTERAKQETINRKAVIEKINEEFRTGVSPVTLNSEAKQLSKGDINNLSKESINRLAVRSDLLNTMKPEALVALIKSSHLSDQDALIGNLETLAKGSTASNSVKIVYNGLANLIL